MTLRLSTLASLRQAPPLRRSPLTLNFSLSQLQSQLVWHWNWDGVTAAAAAAWKRWPIFLIYRGVNFTQSLCDN